MGVDVTAVGRKASTSMLERLLISDRSVLGSFSCHPNYLLLDVRAQRVSTNNHLDTCTSGEPLFAIATAQMEPGIVGLDG
jgi:hypothetical protein